MPDTILKPAFVPRWLFDTTSVVGHTWVVHLRDPGFVGEIVPRNRLGADDTDVPKLVIDDRRWLIIRAFFGDLSLGLGDIEESLRDATTMFDTQ